MKLVSWNVNGLRAVIKKGFLRFLEKEKPDVLCLQEIKIDKEAINKEQFDFPGYEEFYNPAERKGYSGTAVFLKSAKDKSPKAGLIDKFAWDDEGRVQILDLGRFFLANVYFPNANHELSRLDFKIRFNDRLLAELKKLGKTKPAVVCGDFNVAHQPIDLARPEENEGSPGFHPRERAWMDKFLAAGFIDTFRHRYPDKVRYSWWSYRAGARARNVGWRIDYFCVSRPLAKSTKEAFILDSISGSDHCPVGIGLDL